MSTLQQLVELYANDRGPRNTLFPNVSDGCSSWYWAAKHMLADAEMACPARRTARAFASAAATTWSGSGSGSGGNAAYLYQFKHAPLSGQAADVETGFCSGAMHSGEIPFVFHVTDKGSNDDDPTMMVRLLLLLLLSIS